MCVCVCEEVCGVCVCEEMRGVCVQVCACTCEMRALICDSEKMVVGPTSRPSSSFTTLYRGQVQTSNL